MDNDIKNSSYLLAIKETIYTIGENIDYWLIYQINGWYLKYMKNKETKTKKIKQSSEINRVLKWWTSSYLIFSMIGFFLKSDWLTFQGIYLLTDRWILALIKYN